MITGSNREHSLTRASILTFLVSGLQFAATASDYFPYQPKRLTYKFDLHSKIQAKIPPAKLTGIIPGDTQGRYPYRIEVAQLSSIEIELGRTRLTVRKLLLREIDPLDQSTLDFFG